MNARRRILVSALAATILQIPVMVFAQPEQTKIVYVNPETGVLERLYGVWFVTEQHFDERGGVVGIVKGQEEIEWILNDHAIRRTYRTGTEPSVFEAMGILSWNTALKTYRGIWIDNHSTLGPTTVKGEWNERTETFVFELESVAADGKNARYRIVEKFVDADTRRATTYALDGEKLIKRIEVSYKRAEPCPDARGRLRPIGGG